jgi:hypothetical protein
MPGIEIESQQAHSNGHDQDQDAADHVQPETTVFETRHAQVIGLDIPYRDQLQ